MFLREPNPVEPVNSLPGSDAMLILRDTVCLYICRRAVCVSKADGSDPDYAADAASCRRRAR